MMRIFKRIRFIILLKVLVIILIGNCEDPPFLKAENNKENDKNTVKIWIRKTQIVYMDTFDETWLHKSELVNLESTDFIKLVTKGVYVDKSLLLKVIFQDFGDVKCILITHPRRWGKTTNLQMISHFAEMELDPDQKPYIKDYNKTKAYKMFVNGVFEEEANHFADNKQLLISKEINEPVITKHLGRYAVIHLTFLIPISDQVEDNYANFLAMFKFMIIAVYKKFSYIRDNLSKGDLNQFDAILHNKEKSEFVWQSSISLLCGYLRIYFSINHDNSKNVKIPKILILIDEYDYPFNELFFSPNLVKDQIYKSKVINFMNFFIITNFRDKESNYDKVIITGISRLATASGFTAIHSFQMFSSVENDLYPFYGFTEGEVSELLKLRGKPQELETVRYWYDGYRTIGHLNIPTFNPISVIRYLQHGNPAPYWIMTGSKLSDCFGKMLKHFQIFLKLRELLNKDGTILVKTSYLNPGVQHITMMSLITHGENLTTPLSDAEVDSAFVILFSCGFLGLSEIQPNDQKNTISLKIPNLEIKQFWFEAYDTNQFTISRHGNIYRYTVGKNLLKYLQNHNEETFEIFQNSIQEMFKDSGPYTKDMLNLLKAIQEKADNDFISRKLGFLNENEAMAHFLMMEALMTLQRDRLVSLGSELTSSYYTPFRRSAYEYRMDLFAFHNENVIIIEMKADSTVKMVDVLFQAEVYLLFFENLVSKFSYYKLVAINFHHPDNVLVEHKVFSADEVEQHIKKWKDYEKTAKDFYEKESGEKWEHLSVADAKRYIVGVAKKSKPLRMPQILKDMPENLKGDPTAWSITDCSDFIKIFAKHYGIDPPDEKSILFRLNGRWLCSQSVNLLEDSFPTNGKLYAVLKSLTSYFEQQKEYVKLP